MAEFFSGVNSGFKSSMADSIMMLILHSAMDKAHEKVRSKEGVIERLSEQSKFYDLAIIQLEACMRFLQEEVDCFLLENTYYDKSLSDLAEVRDRLHRRLGETEIAIAEKDKELANGHENELKLRKKLELKERELKKLYANKRSGDEGREGDFCELKQSVDQQFSNIRQHLESERMTWRKKRSHGSSSSVILDSDSEPTDVEKDQSLDEKENENLMSDEDDQHNAGFDQMGLEIDKLKQTLDMAFGVMQNAISVSDFHPMEMQWRWIVEKETMSTFFTGLIRDFQQNFKAELKRQKDQLLVGSIRGQLSELMNDLRSLSDDLAGIINPLENVRAKSPVVEGQGKPNKFFNVKDEESSNVVKEAEKDSEEGGRRNLVARMLKKHESIIMQKREKVSCKGHSSSNEGKEFDALKKNVQRVIEKLDKFSQWDAKLNMSLTENTDFSQRNERALLKYHMKIPQKEGSEDIIEKNADATIRSNKLDDEIRRMELHEESSLIVMMADEIHNICLRCLIKDFHQELHENVVKDSISQSIYMIFPKEIGDEVNCWMSKITEQWNKSMEDHRFESCVMEVILQFVFQETFKDIRNHTSFVLNQMAKRDLIAYTSCKQSYANELHSHLESLVREDVYMVIFKEIENARNFDIEAHKVDYLVTEDIYHHIITETMRDVSTLIGEYEARVQGNNFQSQLPTGNVSRNTNVINNGHLIQKLDLLLNFLDLEDKLMLSLGLYTKENHANEVLESWECKEPSTQSCLDGLSIEEKTALQSIDEKLENALQRLSKRKMLLKQFEHYAETRSANGSTIVQGQQDALHEAENVSFSPLKIEGIAVNVSHPTCSSPFISFAGSLENFELMLHQKLNSNFLRLEKIKGQLDPLMGLISSERKRELLYKHAFIRRCENLQKAEIEVDVLGDQVDALLGLLEKIYKVLTHHLPVLQQCSGPFLMNVVTVCAFVQLIFDSNGDANVMLQCRSYRS
ncbi:hypothetical protein Ancab_001390 [Ancistrocladus abbreviatus]